MTYEYECVCKLLFMVVGMSLEQVAGPRAPVARRAGLETVCKDKIYHYISA